MFDTATFPLFISRQRLRKAFHRALMIVVAAPLLIGGIVMIQAHLSQEDFPNQAAETLRHEVVVGERFVRSERLGGRPVQVQRKDPQQQNQRVPIPTGRGSNHRCERWSGVPRTQDIFCNHRRSSRHR